LGRRRLAGPAIEAAPGVLDSPSGGPWAVGRWAARRAHLESSAGWLGAARCQLALAPRASDSRRPAPRSGRRRWSEIYKMY